MAMIIDRLSRESGLTSQYLIRLASSASHRYKEYDIDKKSGGKRRIEHPSRELKLAQRWLVSNVIVHLPVHPAAYAYVRDRGIRDHASLHRKHNFLLKIDFKDFFHSIRSKDLESILRGRASDLNLQFSEDDYWFIRRVAFRSDRLTIGAPSSPAISNAVMYEFDRYCASWSQEVLFSRYADDLFFSTNVPNVLAETLASIRDYLAHLISPRLEINEAKTVFSSRKRLRLVTGLVLTSTGVVSLGRDRKRFVKGQVHQYRLGRLDSDQLGYLRGFLAYSRGVDRAFYDSLVRKFGENVIGSIRRGEERIP